MRVRILSGEDVRRTVDMPAAIAAVREAYAALSTDEATVPMRLALDSERGTTLFMPAHMRARGSAGVKVVSVNAGNPGRGLPVIQAVVLVLDAETGGVLALMDGTWLTALRTGAAGGVAADLLARDDATVVALFGAGVQARAQLEALRCVRPITEVRVVSRTRESADRLVAELRGLRARSLEDRNQALRGADVVIAATDSHTPVFDGSRVEPGTHVTGVGSFTPEMREVDAALVTRARVVVDQREAALAEAGDIIGPIREGLVEESIASTEIGDVVLGRVAGRTSVDEITFFKSVGNAAQDVAVAALVLEEAEQRGLGIVAEV